MDLTNPQIRYIPLNKATYFDGFEETKLFVGRASKKDLARNGDNKEELYFDDSTLSKNHIAIYKDSDKKKIHLENLSRNGFLYFDEENNKIFKIYGDDDFSASIQNGGVVGLCYGELDSIPSSNVDEEKVIEIMRRCKLLLAFYTDYETGMFVKIYKYDQNTSDYGDFALNKFDKLVSSQGFDKNEHLELLKKTTEVMEEEYDMARFENESDKDIEYNSDSDIFSEDEQEDEQGEEEAEGEGEEEEEQEKEIKNKNGIEVIDIDPEIESDSTDEDIENYEEIDNPTEEGRKDSVESKEEKKSIEVPTDQNFLEINFSEEDSNDDSYNSSNDQLAYNSDDSFDYDSDENFDYEIVLENYKARTVIEDSAFEDNQHGLICIESNPYGFRELLENDKLIKKRRRDSDFYDEQLSNLNDVVTRQSVEIEEQRREIKRLKTITKVKTFCYGVAGGAIAAVGALYKIGTLLDSANQAN
jgi:hypothetical protein